MSAFHSDGPVGLKGGLNIKEGATFMVLSGNQKRLGITKFRLRNLRSDCDEGWGLEKLTVRNHVSYSLNSLKGGYIGDYIGDYHRGY